MTHRERVINQIKGKPVDRIPMLGGWINGVRNLADLAGVSLDRYMADPSAAVMQAYANLDVDGCVPPIVPTELDQIRTGSLQESSFASVEPEALRKRADEIPSSITGVLARFDAREVESQYRERFERQLALTGDIALVPTLWEAVANFSLYFGYGYEAFLAAVAMYPDSVERIWWEDAVLSRERNAVIAKLYAEYDLPPVCFTGCDICLNTGPMCSPELLRQRYWPHARYSMEPLVDAGIRLVCHCDGNVMPLVDDFVESGFSGFQGFQYECGVNPYELAKRRSSRGEEPLFFAGLSVSRTLPLGSVEDVIDEVEYCLDYTSGGRGLFLFTSNVTGVEVPPDNIRAAYSHLSQHDPRAACAGVGSVWPWAAKRGG